MFRCGDYKSGLQFLPAYQVSVNTYFRGIGTGYGSRQTMVDLHSSISVTAYSNDVRLGKTWIEPTLHYLDKSYIKNASVIPLKSASSLTFSTNYVLNLQERNQLYGCMLGQLGRLRIQHYNDGGIIMTPLKLGDGRDRWWTGGGFIEYGSAAANGDPVPNRIRLEFDRFTWSNDEGYRSATRSGLSEIPVPEDRIDDALLNTGKYSITLSSDQSQIGIDAFNLFKDLQDLLHETGSLAKHPTIADKYYSLRVNHNIRYDLQ